MTGRGREIADLVARRIKILCVQETRWRGNKSRKQDGGVINQGNKMEG
jgi:hypothetical protein